VEHAVTSGCAKRGIGVATLNRRDDQAESARGHAHAGARHGESRTWLVEAAEYALQSPARMRKFQLLLLTTACLSLFGGCVEPIDEDPAQALGEVETAEVESAIEVTPVPLCPDLVLRLRYSEECFTPRGEGLRECTDTITTHRTPVFKITGIECKTTDTTVTTSCGLCVVLDLPGDEPGDELPF
jgi:hypothetical protein